MCARMHVHACVNTTGTVLVLIRVPGPNFFYSPRGRLLLELKKVLRPWTAPKLGWCLVNRVVMTTL